MGEAHYCPVASVLLLWVRWLQCLYLELPSTETIPKQLLLPSGSAGALCSRRLGLPRPWDLLLGSGETVDQLLTLSYSVSSPPPSPRPSSGTLSSTLCFSGRFSTTAQMGHSRAFPLLSRLLSPSRTDTPVTEVFWARICGRDENADELTDPWVSSGVSAPHHRDRVGGRVGSFSPVQTSVQDGLPLAEVELVVLREVKLLV